MEVLDKVPLPENLEKPMGTCMPVGVVGITPVLSESVAPEAVVTPKRAAWLIPVAALVLEAKEALASLSSASIRRRQHEIRNRN